MSSSLIADSMLPAKMRNKVQYTEEFDRVFNLPRRQPMGETEIAQLSAYLRQNADSDVCQLCTGSGAWREKTCVGCSGSGVISLRPAQAEALREAYDMRGLFGPMRVGSGKTLVSFLLKTLLGIEKAALILPANLRSKTARDFAVALANWKVDLPKIVSYSVLSQPDREGELFALSPDLIILDEAHKTRDTETTTSRRIKRYIDQRNPIVIALSGTMLKAKIMTYHHIMVQSLGVNAPVPRGVSEAEQWNKALEAMDNRRVRFDPGALEGVDFGANLRESRGVVITPGSDVACGLEMVSWAPPTKPETLALVEHVQETNLRPDGEQLGEFEVADCMSQIALGFYYVWDPLPPDWWLMPRRAWYAYEKAIADEHLDGFDCPTNVRNALDHGPRTLMTGEQVMPPGYEEGRKLLAAWRAVKHQFTPNNKAIWVDPDPMQGVADCKPGTLIWVAYTAAGMALQQMGIPFYAGQSDPESAKHGSTIAVSIEAHGTGKNLQFGWHRNRVTKLMANADGWEQLLGRTHRSAQPSDLVTCEYIESIDYHSRVMDRVKDEAARDSAEAGFQAKLLDATWR